MNSLPPDMTGARIALGTPAYMSPEQCRDAATVDHRADIYSLGCTLYVLVTGRPPFDGTTAVELMTKHAYEPLVPPEQIVARVPKEVSAIIQRMMAKDADDRFQTMGEVIRTLEGVARHPPRRHVHARTRNRSAGWRATSTSSTTPRPRSLRRRVAHRVLRGVRAGRRAARVLRQARLGIRRSSGMVSRRRSAYFVLDGVARRGAPVRPHRASSSSACRGATGSSASAASGCSASCWRCSNVFWIWAGFGLIGIGLAFALRYGLDRPTEQEQREPVDACERLLRRLRTQGLDEEEIRQFVAKFAGRDWEEFFEALFGYEAKLAARAVLLRGGAAGVREKHAAWREPLIAAMDRVEKSPRGRARRKAPSGRRAAPSCSRPELRRTSRENRAKAAAEAMVQARPVHVRESERQRASETVHTGRATPVERPPDLGRRGKEPVRVHPEPEARLRERVRQPVRRAARPRRSRGRARRVRLWVTRTVCVGESSRRRSRESRPPAARRDRNERRSKSPAVAPAATAWVDGWNIGVAGLLLLASLFFRGNVMSVFVAARGRGRRGRAPVRHPHRRTVPRRTRRAHARLRCWLSSASAPGGRR